MVAANPGLTHAGAFMVAAVAGEAVAAAAAGEAAEVATIDVVTMMIVAALQELRS